MILDVNRIILNQNKLKNKVFMKTIKYELKLEKSVKIILGTLALGVFLNFLISPITLEFIWN